MINQRDNPGAGRPYRIALIVLYLSVLWLSIGPVFFSEHVLTSSSAEMVGFDGDRYLAYWWLIGLTSFKTIGIMALCFVVAVGLASLIALLDPNAAQVGEGVVQGLRFLPAIAWLPLTMSIFGLAKWHAETVFVALGVCPVVLFHVLRGIAKCSREKQTVARLAHASRLRTFRLVVLPSATEYLRDGWRVGLGLTFVLVIVYEFFVTSVRGAGRIVEALEIQGYEQIDFVIFASILLAMGVAFDRLTLIAWQKRGTAV